MRITPTKKQDHPISQFNDFCLKGCIVRQYLKFTSTPEKIEVLFIAESPPAYKDKGLAGLMS